MRHRKAGRTLGRNAASRLALMRSLSRALIEHGRIITTVAKAKELRPFIEKLVTLAKKANATDDKMRAIHYRRLGAAAAAGQGLGRRSCSRRSARSSPTGPAGTPAS